MLLKLFLKKQLFHLSLLSPSSLPPLPILLDPFNLLHHQVSFLALFGEATLIQQMGAELALQAETTWG
jgi:hypothetical protein